MKKETIFAWLGIIGFNILIILAVLGLTKIALNMGA